MEINQGFPKNVRIVKTDDFSSVFSLRKRIHGDYLVIHYAAVVDDNSVTATEPSVVVKHEIPVKQEKLRFAVVTAKKITKLSVERHYMKRVLRELFRRERELQAAQLPTGLSLEIIVRTQKTFTKQEYLAVKAEFLSLMQRLIKRLNQPLIQANVK